MKRFLAILVISLLSSVAYAADTYRAEKVSFDFNTWVRVEVSAKVVESDDASLKGENSPFIQSLLYTGSISQPFHGNFDSEASMKDQARLQFCSSLFDVDTVPQREKGAKGIRTFKQKLKPSFIAITGILIREKDSKSFTSMVTCSRN
jgi:hypothetical protein